ncbi:AI-2E family transporter [Roseibium sp.]|uniref:AI-2E family transporter n=1 Tax=Roseibium sp. TaxID=1936156 RepID=UPI003A970E60
MLQSQLDNKTDTPVIKGGVRRSLAETASTRFAIWGIFAVAAIWALQEGQGIMVPVMAALFLGLGLGRFQVVLERQGVYPGLAAGFIVVAMVVVCLFAMRILVLPFEEWWARLPEIYAALRRQLNDVKELLLTIESAADAVQETTGIDTSGDKTVVSAPAFLGGIAISLPAAGGQLVLFTGVLYFYLASRSRLTASLTARGATSLWARRLRQTIGRAEATVADYLAVVSAINLGLAVVTGIALALIGLPNAWFWGALAGMLNFIPYVGPFILTLLLLGAGLLRDGTTLYMLLPALVFFAVNLVEANFVTPSVLGKRMRVEPLFVVLSLGFWVWLWGPVGGLLAIPALLVLQSIFQPAVHARP